MAVVRVDSGIQTIVDLRGKRSCHGSVSSLTGWNIPLIVLRDSGLIYPQQCQFGRALASFFSSRYNSLKKENSTKLCDLE